MSPVPPISPDTDAQLRVEPANAFLDRPCVEIAATRYSIWDFLSSVLYTSGVHTVPSTERHRLLYTKFVERRPADAAELLAEIGWCLFDAVEFLHPGEDHAKDELRHLKRIVAGPAPTSKHGQPLIDANGLLRAKYWQDGGSHSGMQAAIEAAGICGLAFTTDIRLNDNVRPKHACLFACGHRHHQASQIEVYQQGSKVFVEIGRNHAQRIEFEASALAVSRPTLRVEVFPSHELSVFVSGSLKGHLRLRQAFRPVNGKFTVGCDLTAKTLRPLPKDTSLSIASTSSIYAAVYAVSHGLSV